MKSLFSFLLVVVSISFGFSQETTSVAKETKFDKKQFLKELSENACKCIDSISTYNKIADSVSSEIHKCIDKQVGAYQMGTKLASIGNLDEVKEGNDGKKSMNITINVNPNSKEYKQYYYEIEKHLMVNCTVIKSKIGSNDVISERSRSNNSEAIKYYNLGLDESQKENYEKAIEYYRKAVVFDPNFAFAYDNIGICSRKLNKYDDAIDAYEKSLKIDPNGLTPLQNIAIAYIYKKEYKKGIKAYEKLAKLDSKNPEVYYGIGNIYAQYLFEYEKALENLCQAYTIYIAQKSPYRTDAETLINVVYVALKKDGKEKVFNEILEKYHISQN
ncbi:tetratricopeptide repeat protein [Flavobacterium sp.]|uniref:tetratricopeptide repeat protein n=1 Tax=Flavobacterium sp. TaxID=239 RepID=UPI0037500EE7